MFAEKINKKKLEIIFFSHRSSNSFELDLKWKSTHHLTLLSASIDVDNVSRNIFI